MSDSQKPLAGEYVLVVDDEPLIAALLEELCIEAGARAICAWQLDAGLEAAANTEITMAILDVRLGKKTSEKIADLLVSRGIPFMFYSGQALTPAIKQKYPGAPLLLKPAISSLIVKLLNKLSALRPGP